MEVYPFRPNQSKLLLHAEIKWFKNQFYSLVTYKRTDEEQSKQDDLKLNDVKYIYLLGAVYLEGKAKGG